MALDNMSQLNPLLQYKCFVCDILPKEEQINRCQTVADHILCILCTIKNGLRCSCGGAITSVVNPLLNVVSTKCCPFKSSGCEWVFPPAVNTAPHTAECKYRPYKCIGTVMHLWKCNWNGMQKDFADHLQRAHLSDRQVFKHWHFGTIPCDPDNNVVIIHLINAFNKKFLFFYVSFAGSFYVHFIVQLLGRKCDADKYMIEFEVGAELKKIKFIEPCHSDASDLLKLLNTKQAMTIPKEYLKQYANENSQIQFQFILKRKTTVIDENRQKEDYFKATMLANLDDQKRPTDSAYHVPKVFSKPMPVPKMHPTLPPMQTAQKQTPTATINVKVKSSGRNFRNKNK